MNKEAQKMPDQSGNRYCVSVGQLRILQFIVLALAAGCGFFGGIVISLCLGKPWNYDLSILTLLALAFGAMTIFFRLIVPPLIVHQARKVLLRRLRDSGSEKVVKNSDPLGAIDADIVGQLFQILLTRTIIAAALLEGAIFFLLIATMAEHSLPALALAALLWLLLIAHFPTRDWTERWIENQQRLLREDRELSHR
jgi:hypothetical protein